MLAASQWSVVGRRYQPDRDTVPWPVDHLDPITGAERSLLQDGQVSARPSGCGEPGRKAWVAHPGAELPAGHPGRGDLQDRTAHSPAFPDQRIGQVDPFGGEVLPEHAGIERSIKLALQA